jgi:hypothetical protein
MGLASMLEALSIGIISMMVSIVLVAPCHQLTFDSFQEVQAIAMKPSLSMPSPMCLPLVYSCSFLEGGRNLRLLSYIYIINKRKLVYKKGLSIICLLLS